MIYCEIARIDWNVFFTFKCFKLNWTILWFYNACEFQGYINHLRENLFPNYKKHLKAKRAHLPENFSSCTLFFNCLNCSYTVSS